MQTLNRNRYLVIDALWEKIKQQLQKEECMFRRCKDELEKPGFIKGSYAIHCLIKKYFQAKAPFHLRIIPGEVFVNSELQTQDCFPTQYETWRIICMDFGEVALSQIKKHDQTLQTLDIARKARKLNEFCTEATILVSSMGAFLEF